MSTRDRPEDDERTGRSAGERWTSDRTAVLRSTAAPLSLSTVETVTGVLDEDAGARGSSAWAARRAQPPAVVLRRWPWAVGAAVAGAGAGAALAYAVGRLRRDESPDVQEPEQVEAVVDRREGPLGG